MTVNGIGNRIYSEILNSQKKNRNEKQEGFYGNLPDTQSNLEQADYEEKAHGKRETADSRMAAISAGFCCYGIASTLSVWSAQITEAVTECDAKGISYKQSDYIKICPEEGYTFKAQINVSRQFVYLEQKREDGTVTGYMADLSKINEDTENTVEQAALEAWEAVRSSLGSGAPEIPIGALQMTNEEWEELLSRVDIDEDDHSADITSLQDRIDNKSKSPYSHLAENGIIEYNGVVFVCDDKNKALCLGDVTSNPKNVLTIPLSGGGTLKVNRDNLGDLANAISMFSPEDINLIMRAVAQDAKIQQMQNELEEDKNSIGDEASEKTAGMDDVTEEMIGHLFEDRM